MPVLGMPREIPRTRFHSSKLIRVLEDLAVADIADSRQSFGERLGQWLDFKDAISLYSVLHGDISGNSARGAAVLNDRSLHDELARVRNALVDAIRIDVQLRMPEAPTAVDSPADIEIDFVPYHRSYLVHQRNMQSAVSSLRAQVRGVLAERSPAGKRLAALDGALEHALAVRERSLLAILPLLLGKRFEYVLLRRRMSSEDNSAPCLQSNDWLAEFCRDVQAVLLAELDLRLQPVLGLMGMLGKEVTEQR